MWKTWGLGSISDGHKDETWAPWTSRVCATTFNLKLTFYITRTVLSFKDLFFLSFSKPNKLVCLFLRRRTVLLSISSHAHALLRHYAQACWLGTIAFGSPGLTALKNIHSNYSISVLVLFPPLKPYRQSLLTSASLFANTVQMPTLQCSSFWCAWLKVFFLCQCWCVYSCTCVTLCICVCVCACLCLLGLGSWKHTHG